MNKLVSIVCFIFSVSAADEIEMKPRPTDEKDFPEYIQYLVDVLFPRTAEERAKDEVVMKRYQSAHNIDSIFIAAPGFPAGFTF